MPKKNHLFKLASPLAFKLVKIYVFTLVVFTIFRLLNYLINIDGYYSDLTFYQVMISFLRGVRFDASVSMLLFAVPFLLSIFPSLKIQWVGLRLVFASFAAQLFVLGGNLLYFQQVNRHMFDELLTLRGEWSFIFNTMAGGYLFLIVGFLIVLAASYRIYIKWIERENIYVGKSLFLILSLVAASVLLIRGGLQRKPIAIVNAYTDGGAAGGQLTLNGLFSAWHAGYNSHSFSCPDSNPAVIANFRKVLQQDAREHPFSFAGQKPKFISKELKNLAQAKPNIVLFLLESWSNVYVDGFSRENLEVTPFFKSIAEKSYKYENFYATGSRSIEALQSIMTSFPSLRGLPDVDTGLSMLNIAHMGSLVNQQGYLTYLMQSAARESFHLHSIASLFGFQNYFGLEDYPLLEGALQPTPIFGRDKEMFMFSKNLYDQHVSKTSKPFFSLLFTGTTHIPFVKASKRLFAREHGARTEKGFLNALNYTDYHLMKFFEAAKKSSWFDNTVFIFTADHSLQTFRKFNYKDRFAVPLVIYAPKFLTPRNVPLIGSHLDLLPTVLDIIGSNTEASVAGRSMLRDYSYRYALQSRRFSNPGLIDKDGYSITNYEKIIEQKTTPSCGAACKKRQGEFLQNFLYYLYHGVLDDTWMSED